MKRVMIVAAVMAVLWSASVARAATLQGTVLTAGETPADQVTVVLVEARRSTVTGADGAFVFENLPAGNYLLSAESRTSGGAVMRVEVADDGEPLTVVLDQRVHAGSLSVTAAGIARSLSELVAPVDVLTGDSLDFRREATLGETLKNQPGVASSTYGQGSSRPVIRAQAGDRIRILENGLDTGDVSSIGPDHAVSANPLAAESIEVVRGAATLLYGGNAIGGVVNVSDGRIPDREATEPISGEVELFGGTVADQWGGRFRLDGGSGHFAWHVNGFIREADDYESPAEHLLEEGEHHEGEHDHDDDEHHDEGEEHEGEDDHDHDHDHEGDEVGTGRVPNTFAESAGASVGLSYVTDRGFIGIAFSGLDAEYGIPGHHHHHEGEHDHDGEEHHDEGEEDHEGEDDHDHEGEEEVGVFTKQEQRRIDIHGQLDRPTDGLRALRFTAGWRDYEHREIEGDEIGTRFTNEFTEIRAEALHEPLWGVLEGTVGLHWMDRDFAAAGEEAFVQPTTTNRLAAFIYEETPIDPVGVQFGLRFERQETDSIDPTLSSRDFDTFSASTGIAFEPTDSWRIGMTVSRAERAPTAEELYADGPHAATRAYEIGDQNLNSEVGMGADLTFRYDAPRFVGTASFFATGYEDYIYLLETGEERDGFEVQQFVQADANFYGFELHGDYELLHLDPHHLHLEVGYDQVRAHLDVSGEALPRTPPARFRTGLVYHSERWTARVEGVMVAEQDRVAEHEETTDDYTMLNASVGYRFFTGDLLHEVMLRGTNLTDEAAYNHVSFIKRQAPLPGIDVNLSYRVRF
jgi:iron complex outermembrane receptor protein